MLVDFPFAGEFQRNVSKISSYGVDAFHVLCCGKRSNADTMTKGVAVDAPLRSLGVCARRNTITHKQMGTDEYVCGKLTIRQNNM